MAPAKRRPTSAAAGSGGGRRRAPFRARPCALLTLVALLSATNLFVGVETALSGTGPDTPYFTGDLLRASRLQRLGDRADAEPPRPPPLLLAAAGRTPPEVYRSNAPVQPTKFEQAGASHYRLLRLRAGLEDIDAERSRSASAGERGAAPAAESREEAERRAAREGVGGEDHYEALGLGDVRWRATEDEIKKAYHRTSLRCHPDKMLSLGPAAQKAADEYYKKVNRAYVVLSNREKVWPHSWHRLPRGRSSRTLAVPSTLHAQTAVTRAAFSPPAPGLRLTRHHHGYTSHPRGVANEWVL
jgi:hypothetical protein